MIKKKKTTKGEEKKKSAVFRRSFFVFLSGAIFLLLIIHIYTLLYSPPKKEKISRIITIQEGASFYDAARLLEAEGLISSRRFFVLLGRGFGADRRIKAGEYSLNTAMLPLDVLDIIRNGKVYHHKIIIPEGYSIRQIGRLLEEEGLVDFKDYGALVHNKDFIQAFGIDGPSLEGYLFPETYFFAKNQGLEEIISAMVSKFFSVYTPEFENRARQLGMTMREVLTLASIIERETGAEEEMPVVSAVYHNRLKKNMPLQSDPTVIYGIKNFNGNITKKDLQTKTPYNTYRIKGLPPSPIANPGRRAIYAALYPANVPYLYFVSKNNGRHHFSTDLKEHNKAVWKYQVSPYRKNKTLNP
ncbi:MAG: endolytic transglycosylase MltG [Nitrospirae bacterium]|nr:endolytic transglycosylase MltG [Nitrospirota bacterium]